MSFSKSGIGESFCKFRLCFFSPPFPCLCMGFSLSFLLILSGLILRCSSPNTYSQPPCFEAFRKMSLIHPSQFSRAACPGARPFAIRRRLNGARLHWQPVNTTQKGRISGQSIHKTPDSLQLSHPAAVLFSDKAPNQREDSSPPCQPAASPPATASKTEIHKVLLEKLAIAPTLSHGCTPNYQIV